MQCPYCGSEELSVLESRDSADSLRRRRECVKCKKRFTTYERVEAIDLFVVKKDGRRERFERNKVKNGVLHACEKRDVSMEKIDSLVSEVERDLMTRGDNEISSKEVGELVMKKLVKLDKVAYIRFASVYKEFEEAKDFVKEIKKL